MSTSQERAAPVPRASKDKERAESDARYFAARDAAWDEMDRKTARLRAMRMEREATEAEAIVAVTKPAKRTGRIRRH